MKFFKKHKILILFVILILSSSFFVFSAFSQNNQKENDILKVIFLDVGQGDAIYIEAPNGAQMLIDSGADRDILKNLSKVMPYGDKSIDMIVLTHPDKDHIGGFSDVLNNYEVGSVLESGNTSNTQVYKRLITNIENKKIKRILARRGLIINLDKNYNIYFEVLFPDRDVSTWESNDASIVGRVVYGEQSFLLTGDGTLATEHILIKNENYNLASTVLKLGHHGSKTSSGENFLKFVNPSFAIISAGENNSYGHPHKEVLDRLQTLGIPYLATYDESTIVCISNMITIDCK